MGMVSVIIRLGIFLVFTLTYIHCLAPVNSIPVKVVNHAGAPIEVFWIDTFSNDGTLVRQTTKPLRNSSDANINSYDGHSFLARFLDDIPGVEAFFTKGPSQETVLITYNESTATMHAKQITKFDEIIDLINLATVSCNELSEKAYADCIGEKVLDEVQRLNETTLEIKKYRDLMAPRVHEYICADDKPNATEPLRSQTFEDRKEKYIIDHMIDTDTAQMWKISNAISSRECEMLLQHSKIVSAVDAGETATLTVSGSDGTTLLNLAANTDKQKHDKIHAQRTYEIDQLHPDKDPLWPLFSKIYKMVNGMAKLKLPVLPTGQEGFGVTHYAVGEGVRPHCAGVCDHSPYKLGERVASAVLFCQVAELGGTLHFPKSDVVIHPEVGTAVVFSYKHANTTETDDGYVEHSLCPVRQGSQTVVSLHLRSGVASVRPPTLTSPAAATKP